MEDRESALDYILQEVRSSTRLTTSLQVLGFILQEGGKERQTGWRGGEKRGRGGMGRGEKKG